MRMRGCNSIDIDSMAFIHVCYVCDVCDVYVMYVTLCGYEVHSLHPQSMCWVIPAQIARH